MNSKSKSAMKASPLAVIVFAVAWILVGCSSSPPASQTVAATAPAVHHSAAYNDLMTWKTDGGYAALQVLGSDLNRLHNPADMTQREYSTLQVAIQAAKNYPLPDSVDPRHQYDKALRQIRRGVESMQDGNLLTGVSQLELGTATMLDVKSRVEEVKADG